MTLEIEQAIKELGARGFALTHVEGAEEPWQVIDPFEHVAGSGETWQAAYAEAMGEVSF